MKRSRRPAAVFPPGTYILEEMGARSWDILEFCHVSGYSIAEADAIIDGRQDITPEIALTLARTFGTSGELWLNLGAAWQRREG